MALQQDLVELEKWEKEWQMSFNPSKCSLLRFSPTRKAKEFDYKIHDTKLEQCHTHKYLGVLLSDEYKWSEHIDQVAKKANRSLGFVLRNTHGCSRHFKEAAYKSLVRPHLEYCSSVWNPHTQTNITKLERVQRRGARYAMSDHRRTSSVMSMIGELGWEDLATRRTVSRMTMMKNLGNEVELPVAVVFEHQSKRTCRSHDRQLKRYQPRGDIDKHAFAQRSIPEWNSLPRDIVHSDSYDRDYLLLT